MRTGLCIVFLFFLTGGCKNKNEVPGNVLSQKKMQAILWDMMRADQFLADYILNKDTTLLKKTESLKYYRQVFAIHQVSKEEFQRSFSFYQSHPALFRAIMDSIGAPPREATPGLAPPEMIPVEKEQDPGAQKKARPLSPD
ncbi:MAG: DUF4296 domain-containing protein [Ferruginibacter sp.]|nr:DUF4296 domain-containing protein [Chitinophagaceae bacterium]